MDDILFRVLIPILIIFQFIRFLMIHRKYSKDNLDKIAQNGISSIGFFSEESVYQAFLEAGLSPEKAREEARKRVFHLD